MFCSSNRASGGGVYVKIDDKLDRASRRVTGVAIAPHRQHDGRGETS